MRQVVAVALLTAALLAGSLGGADSPTTADEQTLKAAGIGTDGPGLLTFFRSHSLADADRQRIQGLIRQLGDGDFDVREKASADLVAQGHKALALVRPALKDSDLEVARRATEIVRQLEQTAPNTDAGQMLAIAAARLVAVRKPAGAAEALLGYLPFAGREPVLEEIEKALAAVALPEGKVDPALTVAVTAGDAAKRGIAGAALARVGQGDAVRKLLQDPEPGVRLRVALGLTHAREKVGVPVLIALLGELSPEQVWPAEEVLRQLAGDKSPAVSLGTDAAGRGRCRDAWAVWWRDNAATANMAAVNGPPPLLGYTLVVVPDFGSVMELDPERKVRWQIRGLRSPFDAQVLPGGRVLIAEYAGFVTERNQQGEVLWEQAVPAAMQVQRLPSGNTFVVTVRNLLEIEPGGKQRIIYTHTRKGSLVAARKARNGEIIAVDSSGNCSRLDADGKQLSVFPVGRISNNCVSVLPDGHILIAKYFDGKVTEYDADGKEVAEVPCPSAFSAQRLPRGTTLVACHEPPRVVEVDRKGEIVREFPGETANSRPWYASRR
jgi:hypothetical protein